jgi:hypothetical protein
MTIKDDRIHYFIYAQDSTKVWMDCADTPWNRKFVAWVELHDTPFGARS